MAVMRDHTEVVKAIRQQNWKLGGALCVDVPEAESAVFDLAQDAARVMHERCLDAAEKAAKYGNASMVVDAIRNVYLEV